MPELRLDGSPRNLIGLVGTVALIISSFDLSLSVFTPVCAAYCALLPASNPTAYPGVRFRTQSGRERAWETC